ncbi:MAG: lytic murein transglycosylase [Rubellimicrobium sp.]|nr:lytic murein transglycosylase [Rubellimicrobium sp.]
MRHHGLRTVAQHHAGPRPCDRWLTPRPPGPDPPAPAASFDDWRRAFRDRAVASGLPEAVLDSVLPGLTPLPRVVELDRNQFEFSRTIWDYLAIAVSDDRVTLGRRALAANADLLAEIEAAFDVEREILVAIWGLESSFGGYRGTVPTLSALATLAHDGRRATLFENQLLAALEIVALGEATPEGMVGSWAGAMGHTQFMPTSFLAHAVDFRGTGRRDIWSDDPTDALASAAAYLAHYGWARGQPWGVEVILPEGFDYLEARKDNPRPPGDWAGMGIRATDGSEVPDHGPAVILLPAGHRGAAFMTFGNFNVLERYNTADAYVIALGHLADRIAGGPPIAGDWPREDRALTFAERMELQTLLTEAGFDPQGIDGLVGPLTIAAVRAWQVSQGLVPDGYASPAVLEALRNP